MENINLKSEDYEFLSAIRDIENDPDNLGEPENAETPATTSAIRKLTSLSRDQINYRMDRGSSKRGFTVESGAGLVEVFPPTKFGYSKSAQLTERGYQILDEYDESSVGTAGATGAVIDGEQSVENLQEQIDSLQNEVEELEDTIADVAMANTKLMLALQEVLNLDPQDVEREMDAKKVRQLRRDVFIVINKAIKDE